jgi:glycosyltransferase involved in cell wall biosynthesis
LRPVIPIQKNVVLLAFVKKREHLSISSHPFLSFVVPIHNELENIEPLCKAISVAMNLIPNEYEMILVNDGSTDKSWSEIEKQTEEFPELVGINFQTNYGQSAALSAGIQRAIGDLIITLDGDLQNDPGDVPMMLEVLQKEDCDVVAGERVTRQDKVVTRKIPSRIANYMIRVISGVKLRDYGCALRVFRADVAKNLDLYGELHRFIPVLAVLQGARTVQVPVKHHARQFGKSKYGLGRTFKVMSDLLFMVFFKRYRDRPIHLFGSVGLLAFGAGFLINFYMLVLKILGQDIWGKPLLLLGFILTLGGIQIITIGLLAEVLMRTYYESQNKKPYRIRKIISGRELQDS